MSNYVWGEKETQFFFNLDPNNILSSIEKLGYQTTGRCLPLNSMENRVYEIEIDIDESKAKSPSDHFVVAKFYRPGRWSKEQILEEHQFLFDLQENEISVIAPIKIDGTSLFELEECQLFYAIFPKMGGRSPEEMNDEQLEIMGRSLARIHNVGAMRKADHRITITPQTYGVQNLEFLKQTNFLSAEVRQSYTETVTAIIQDSISLFEGITNHRIHGDFHKGNIIMRNETPYFVDFDDMLMGPAVQDVWPIVPGDDQESIVDRSILLEAYETMRPFPHDQLKLIPALRALRLIHFSAWIAKRWEDPAFQNTFTYFNTPNYWYQQVGDLKQLHYKILEGKNPYQY
jgi:Ser/Thr protein kinase RdoA (MazF antagonist)